MYSTKVCLSSGSPKRMNRLLAVAVLTSATYLCGCTSTNPSAAGHPAAPKPSPRETEILPAAQVAATSTQELMTRRAQLHEQISEIQREVEMKAGLHMGVAIHDDRSKLTELYREARQIDRELLRRAQNGQGGARLETVKAEF